MKFLFLTGKSLVGRFVDELSAHSSGIADSTKTSHSIRTTGGTARAAAANEVFSL